MSMRADPWSDFARELYTAAFDKGVVERGCNAVISPISIQTSLMLALVGAAGRTAEQLRAGLRLDSGDLQHIARYYQAMWTQLCSNGKGITLKSMNRLFVNQKLSVHREFNAMAEKYFNYKPEPLNFADPNGATQQINELVELATEHKIRDLLQPDAVNAETSAVLVNVLYFKGLFRKPFTPEWTTSDDFYIDQHRRVEVDMMYQEDKFKYVELPELEARAIELPFEDSDIQLLIMLPNKVCGLRELEQQLSQLDFADLEQRMHMVDVDIALPRFGIEFDLDLTETLKLLGICDVFGNTADLSRLFQDATGQKISAAKHRGYIDVNEAGCEAAAVTYLKVVPMSLIMHKKTFKVNHPFVFFIRSSKVVLFAGRFVAPQLGASREPTPTPTHSHTHTHTHTHTHSSLNSGARK
ncbi:serine protease inhibitor 42Dd-like isoform X2 [Drosophila hydei]|nr:serine protease inhibitor 42Dd-like isoform X2 [Drosophila hydei]